MKKIFFIILLNSALANICAQTRVVNKIIFPVRRDIVFTHKDFTPAPLFHDFEISTTTEPTTDPLLFFNSQPLFNSGTPLSRFLFIFTELSFADVLEGKMNSVKPGIVNTYDDNISELFKDAPSLVKLKCIIRL